MTKLKVRDVLRYARPYSNRANLIDGFKNHFSVTDFTGLNQVVLERGISPIAPVNAVDGKRVPAILIRSSPHKIGSETTPWQDIFDIDNGYIRYFGDNKRPGEDPANTLGNNALLRAFALYNDPQKRHLAPPLIFYKSVLQNSQTKGYVEFNGFGIITKIELVTQYDRKLNRTFSNFAFVFQVFSLTAEREEFDWKWINDRRDKNLPLDDTYRNAPESWKDWIRNGSTERNRRRVSKLLTLTRNEQLPQMGSKEDKIIKAIYHFYSIKKARFEGLASAVTTKIMNDAAEGYSEGWITPAGSDGGVDFYGRLEIGSGFGKAKLILLGQAKCEKPDIPTGGNHVARTVARLRRGWVGVYVTTSFFSEAVQREIIEDEYPIMLINGKKLAETVLKILHDNGFATLEKYLEDIDSKFDSLVRMRRPEELLFE
jgi:AspBHI-like restriction endonuclease/restriction endonuclease